MTLLAATLRSLAFLTRLPPVSGAFGAAPRLGDDVHAFPLAGLVAALPSALVLLAAGALGLSPLVGAVLAVATLVAVTGALHEDGLGDVADGLGGHHEKARALAIMKDSRIGSYGALTLILSVCLRVAVLADLAGASPLDAALAMLAAAAGSRGAMGWLWASLPSADPGGLANRMGQPTHQTGRRAALLGALLLVLVGAGTRSLAGITLALLLGVLSLGQFRKFIMRRLGGQTGDCLGAAQQIVEIAVLLGFAIAAGLR